MTKEQVVEDNSKLIYKIATKFYGVSKEDLYQAGMTGLIKAYQQYNPNPNTKFSTFAYKYIFGEMYQLANKKILNVTRDTLKMYKYIEKSRYLYAQELGYIPSNADLASLLNLSLKTIDQVCTSGYEIMSLDNASDSERSYYETIPKTESLSCDDKMMLYETISQLPKDEQSVILARYFKDETQETIASKLNTSQVKISRLEKKGLTRMRRLLETH